MHYCKICGFPLDKDPSCGDICPCCFCEYEFDDFMSKEDAISSFCDEDEDLLYILAPKTRELADEDILPPEISWKLLRLAWLKKGATCYKYDKHKLPLDQVRIQLQNIHQDYDKLLPLTEKITLH